MQSKFGFDEDVLEEDFDGQDSISSSIKSIEGGIIKRIFSLAQDRSIPAHIQMLYAAFFLQIFIFIIIVIVISVSFDNSFNDLISTVNEMSQTRRLFLPYAKSIATASIMGSANNL